MTRIKWTPRKNTEREAVRKHGDSWWLIRSGDDRLLISNTPDWKAGDLRWIFGDQVIACQ